jgi:hypothetical protein
MKWLCWLLIILGAVAFVVGAVLAFGAGRWTLLLSPQGYWRGAMGFLMFAIALRLMEEKR